MLDRRDSVSSPQTARSGRVPNDHLTNGVGMFAMGVGAPYRPKKKMDASLSKSPAVSGNKTLDIYRTSSFRTLGWYIYI